MKSLFYMLQAPKPPEHANNYCLHHLKGVSLLKSTFGEQQLTFNSDGLVLIVELSCCLLSKKI